MRFFHHGVADLAVLDRTPRITATAFGFMIRFIWRNDVRPCFRGRGRGGRFRFEVDDDAHTVGRRFAPSLVANTGFEIHLGDLGKKSVISVETLDDDVGDGVAGWPGSLPAHALEHLVGLGYRSSNRQAASCLVAGASPEGGCPLENLDQHAAEAEGPRACRTDPSVTGADDDLLPAEQPSAGTWMPSILASDLYFPAFARMAA